MSENGSSINQVMSTPLFGDMGYKNPEFNEAALNLKSKNRHPNKSKAKDVVLPHSQAKLTLYSKYLEKYLAILSVVNFIEKIHVFDVFCGTGIYKDEKFGSPILAFKAIEEVDIFLRKEHNHGLKETKLYINDIDIKNVNKVKEFISSKPHSSSFSVEYFNLDARKMLENALSIIQNQKHNERNLILLDPYGYSQIEKDIIQRLMQTGKVEIIIFLPASHMHRFKDIVQKEEKKAYESLKKLVL